MDLYVIDLETTGLKGYPVDKVVEIAVCHVDLEKKEWTPIYEAVIGHDTKKWPKKTKEAYIFKNSSLTVEAVDLALRLGVTEETVTADLRRLLTGKIVTSYNIDFDFNKFLNHSPYKMREYSVQGSCIMLAATDVCKFPNRYYAGYKYAKLDESWLMFKAEDPELFDSDEIDDQHRAMADTIATCKVLIHLYNNGNYTI